MDMPFEMVSPVMELADNDTPNEGNDGADYKN
jgi:hypothetical protein